MIVVLVLGLGLFPVIAAPLSEEFGRKKIYVVSYIGFILITAVTALGQRVPLGAWLFFRFLAGCFGSV